MTPVLFVVVEVGSVESDDVVNDGDESKTFGFSKG